MKKKVFFALLLAGMSFATPSKVEAQGTAKVSADGWRIYVSWRNVEGCWFSGDTCFPDDIVVTP